MIQAEKQLNFTQLIDAMNETDTWEGFSPYVGLIFSFFANELAPDPSDHLQFGLDRRVGRIKYQLRNADHSTDLRALKRNITEALETSYQFHVRGQAV